MRASRAHDLAAKPRPTDKHNRRSGISGAPTRTRRATRCVNSGLSMMTNTSGLAAITASAVSRMRRRIFGRLVGIAESPMIARSPSGNRLGDACRRHMGTADAGKLRTPLCALSERTDQCRAETIARFLARNEKDMRARHAIPGATPTTKIRALSAACTSRSGSATIAPPASTAIPASPALMTPSTVCGPIDGRSKRRSWPRFGAFTNTPLPASVCTRPLRRISAMRASI